jgi:hypothetical protein
MPKELETPPPESDSGPDPHHVYEYLMGQISAAQLCILAALEARLSTNLNTEVRKATELLKATLNSQHEEYKENKRLPLIKNQLITATQSFQKGYAGAVNSYIEATQDESSESECRTAVLFLAQQMNQAIEYSNIPTSELQPSMATRFGIFASLLGKKVVDLGEEDDRQEASGTP